MPTQQPDDARRLAALIATAKANKTTKAAILEPFRAVLMKERNAGTSVRIMVGSLASMGVNISEESLRIWFVQQGAPKPRKSVARLATIAATPKRPATAMPTVPASGPRVARADI
jgi:hypothetical protein